MKQIVYLVRHGETIYNREDRMRGRFDEPLCENGIKEANKTADFFGEKEISHVFSGPLLRALNTAEIIASACKLTVEKEEAFNDFDFGNWQGRLRSDIKRQYSGHYFIYENHPEEFISSSGDSLWALQRRSYTRLREITSEISKNIIIVSHYVTIRMILLACLNLTPREYWSINLDNCSLSEVYVKNNSFILNRLNNVCHLIT